MAQEVEEVLQNCLRLAAQDKISAKNSWDLTLIDHIDDVIDVASAQEFMNFQQISSTLNATVKIYSGRVDSLLSTTYNVAGALMAQIANETPEDDNEDSEDSGKKKRKPKTRKILSHTIVDPSKLNMKPFLPDVTAVLDPVFPFIFSSHAGDRCPLYEMPIFAAHITTGGSLELDPSSHTPDHLMAGTWEEEAARLASEEDRGEEDQAGFMEDPDAIKALADQIGGMNVGGGEIKPEQTEPVSDGAGAPLDDPFEFQDLPDVGEDAMGMDPMPLDAVDPTMVAVDGEGLGGSGEAVEALCARLSSAPLVPLSELLGAVGGDHWEGPAKLKPKKARPSPAESGKAVRSRKKKKELVTTYDFSAPISFIVAKSSASISLSQKKQAEFKQRPKPAFFPRAFATLLRRGPYRLMASPLELVPEAGEWMVKDTRTGEITPLYLPDVHSSAHSGSDTAPSAALPMNAGETMLLPDDGAGWADDGNEFAYELDAPPPPTSVLVEDLAPTMAEDVITEPIAPGAGGGAPGGVMDETLCAFQAQLQVGMRMVKVKYAKKPKKVDVHVLKENVWKEIDHTLTPPTDADEAPKAMAFSHMVRDYENYHTHKAGADISQITVPFHFITLLHLANEKTLRLTQAEDGEIHIERDLE